MGYAFLMLAVNAAHRGSQGQFGGSFGRPPRLSQFALLRANR
jgi:hypothetical protein